MNLCHTNINLAYFLTYEDMQNEINEKYESFAKATKKRAKPLLLMLGGRGDYGGSCGGGRGGGRGQED